MLTSKRVLCAALFCLTGLAVPVSAQAAEWRILSVDIELLDLGESGSPEPLVNAVLTSTRRTFEDGHYAYYLASGLVEPATPLGWNTWSLDLTSSLYSQAPSVDLSSMTARFDGAELRQTAFYPGDREGWVSIELPFSIPLGLNQAVAITQVAEGRYQTNWQVHTRANASWQDASMPLYAVNLTFETVPGTMPTVPEPSAVLLVLAGVGAVAGARRRVARPLSSA